MNPSKYLKSAAAALVLLLVPAVTGAAPLRNIPSTFVQPDGTVVNLLTTGDEYSRRTFDSRNFTVLRDYASGWLVYADLVDGRLAPTILAAGIDDPAAAGIRPGLYPTADQVHQARLARRSLRSGEFTPSTGVVNNLFVFIRFSDDDTLLEETSGYESKFNGLAQGEASMRAFFNEVSRGAVDVRTVFTPAPDGAWMTAWTSPKSRTYFQPWDATSNPGGYTSDYDAQVREHTLLSDALAAVESQIPADIDFDANDDGYFDNVIFMVQGWPDGWADLLWPHMWEFYEEPSVAGLKVGTYNLQLSVLMLISPGTFAHEMYHSFGAPDLYHYNQDELYPVGPWDLMEDTGLESAQHPLAYMKWKYGNWVDDIPLIEQNQEVTLASNWDAGNQAVRVKVAESDNEYFVIEYRRKQGMFDSQLPMSGLLVYRINPLMQGVGNMNGPPDEVYVFRPGGTEAENGKLKEAPLRPDRRNLMNEVTDPSPALGDGTPVTLRIYDLGEMGDTITFKVSLIDPGCGEKVCGTDGMGGWCGDCPEQNWCSAGTCVPCSCEGRECGANECGVSCGTCDDANECTTDTCEEFQCVFQTAAGNACDDGDACTKDDACGSDGTCAGLKYFCIPGECEKTSECDGIGGCEVTYMETGTPCDDGNAESEGDQCISDGFCHGEPWDDGYDEDVFDATDGESVDSDDGADFQDGDADDIENDNGGGNGSSGGCSQGSTGRGIPQALILLIFSGMIAAARWTPGYRRVRPISAARRGDA